MAAKTREELVTEYEQYGPTALNNLQRLLQSDVENCEENAKEAPTPEWAEYWNGLTQDYQLELSVCEEFLAQQPAK